MQGKAITFSPAASVARRGFPVITASILTGLKILSGIFILPAMCWDVVAVVCSICEFSVLAKNLLKSLLSILEF